MWIKIENPDQNGFGDGVMYVYSRYRYFRDRRVHRRLAYAEKGQIAEKLL